MTPQQIIFLSIVGIALVALIFLSESQKRYNLDSIKRKTVGDGQYGTARWATQEEIQSSTIQVPYEPEAWRYNKESRPTTAGIVVNLKQNKKQILATIDPSDSHTLMVAGTGGGKTTTFMIPNIEYALACGTSFISTDSKGDLLRLYGKLCEQYGYTCLNINFRTPMKSDSYNYMQLINLYIDMWRDDPKRVDYHSRAERYAKALANSIVHTKGFDGGGQNSYFYDSSEGLITSIILLVAQDCKPEERHIVSVFKILLEFVQTVKSANDETDSQRKVKQTKLNEILSLLPEDDKIRWFAGSVPGSEGMQYLSVITTSMSRLLAFIDSESENILCKNSKITVADIYQKKVAVFITFPEEDATKHVLVSLFLSQIINEAIVYADERTKENREMVQGRTVHALYGKTHERGDCGRAQELDIRPGVRRTGRSLRDGRPLCGSAGDLPAVPPACRPAAQKRPATQPRRLAGVHTSGDAGTIRAGIRCFRPPADGITAGGYDSAARRICEEVERKRE